MKWIDRVLTALRSAARDLISEEDIAAEEDHVAALLDTAQARLNVLRDELATAIAREKRAEIEWHEAVAQANALDVGVDAALRAGQDEAARAQIVQASRAQIKADDLSEHYQACQRVSTRLREEVMALQDEIDETQERYTHLNDRERSAQSLEQLNQLRHEQRKETRTLHSELDERKEQVAKREDHIAAREEIDSKK